MKRTVGVMLVGALALAGCGSDDDKAADGGGPATPAGERSAITGLDPAFGSRRCGLDPAGRDRRRPVPVGHRRQGRQDLRRRLRGRRRRPGHGRGPDQPRRQARPHLLRRRLRHRQRRRRGQDGRDLPGRGRAVHRQGRRRRPLRARPDRRGRRRPRHRHRHLPLRRHRHSSTPPSAPAAPPRSTSARASFVPPAAGSTATTNSVVGDTMWGLTVLPDDRLVAVGAKAGRGRGAHRPRLGPDDVHRRRRPRPVLRHRRHPHHRRQRRQREPPPGGRAARRQDRHVRLHPHHGHAARRGPLARAGAAQRHPRLRPSARAASPRPSSCRPSPRPTRSACRATPSSSPATAGPPTTEKVDLIAARFTADGTWDKTFGDERPGADRHRRRGRPGPRPGRAARRSGAHRRQRQARRHQHQRHAGPARP